MHRNMIISSLEQFFQSFLVVHLGRDKGLVDACPVKTDFGQLVEGSQMRQRSFFIQIVNWQHILHFGWTKSEKYIVTIWLKILGIDKRTDLEDSC